MGSADADVAEFPGDSEGDGAGLVDDVVADAVVGVSVSGGPGQRPLLAGPVVRPGGAAVRARICGAPGRQVDWSARRGVEQLGSSLGS